MDTKHKQHGENRVARKAKRRKLEDRIVGLPQELEDAQRMSASGTELYTPSTRRDPRNDEAATLCEKGIERKRKRRGEEFGSIGILPTIESLNGPMAVVADLEEIAPQTKRSKKERKAEKKALIAAQVALGNDGTASRVSKNHKGPQQPVMVAKMRLDNDKDEERQVYPKAAGLDTPGDPPTIAEDKDRCAHRFIVFIGNLPYTANTESIWKHFEKVKPSSVRHLTKKEEPSASKGYAFLEFYAYDHMKTCLKLFHHSTFDDGKSNPRKINVELTAGGGGNSKERKAKIKQKNHKLQEERTRKIREEIGALAKKSDDLKRDDIHPSRRVHIAGL